MKQNKPRRNPNKPQSIEEDYENWTKDKNGYHVPLNEPRKLKKNVFSK